MLHTWTGKHRIATCLAVPEGATIASWGEHEWMDRHWLLPEVSISEAYNAVWVETTCMCGAKIRSLKAARHLPAHTEIRAQQGTLGGGATKLVVTFDGEVASHRIRGTKYTAPGARSSCINPARPR